jgi:hypothetical protein
MAPHDIPATTTCGLYGLYAETATTYSYLLGCSADTLKDTPTMTINVGSVVQVAGALAPNVQLSVPTGQSVARVEGLVVRGLAPGTITVMAHFPYCYSSGPTQPPSCPLMKVIVQKILQ